MSDEKNIQDNNLKKKITIIAAAVASVTLIVLIVVLINYFNRQEEQKKASGKGKYQESNQADGVEAHKGEENIFDVAIREYESGISEEVVPESSELTATADDTETPGTTAAPSTTATPSTTAAPTTTQAPVTECPHYFETVSVEGTGHWETVQSYETVTMVTYTCDVCGYFYQEESSYVSESGFRHEFCANCQSSTRFNISSERVKRPIVGVYEDVWVEETPSYAYEKCVYCGMVR